MSRLIDADELMNYCLNLKEKKIDCNDIARFPTAYNVDQVAEEIEELTSYYKDCTKYGNKDAKQRDLSYGTTLNYEVASYFDEILEIVKRGGVNEM